MIFTKIWQRYFLVEILKTFFLFLLCFFILYALIDYSMHMQEIMKNKRISIVDLAIYYGMLFSKRCDLLLPLSLLIASVKVLTSLNRRNELLALQTSGIAVHRLTRPFFFVGLICVGLSYCNFEVLAPKSLNYIDHFEKKYLKKKSTRKVKKSAIHALPLEDGTRLLYQKYDAEEKEFFDLFWILSIDELYHIKTLKVTGADPVGAFVDHMVRNEKGEIKKVASYPSLPFKNLNLNFDLQDHLSIPMENRSISDLLAMTLNKTPLFYENRSTVHTHLYFKLFMPWLPVLVLIGVVPFCVPSVRFLPTFLIFSVTIFGYITFFTVMDGCVILGETQALPSFWAIFTLPIAFFAIFGPRFIKMCIKTI
ncbi:MAG: LptF/LptG family permease [Simkaniaceae bacterium]|jgi:lipopolysaccharide export system permease protein|nr:MAG: LptF/LptG family permease [Simkaniaceae bacterium]